MASRTNAADLARFQSHPSPPSQSGLQNFVFAPSTQTEFDGQETIVFQRGPLFWKVGVNVALGLGVADVCCRFGMAPFRIRPLHRYQICLDEICFLLNGLGDKIVRTWCCRGCGRRALGFMCAPRAKPPTATSGVLLTTVSAVRGRRARVTAENRNPPDRLAGDGAEVP